MPETATIKRNRVPRLGDVDVDVAREASRTPVGLTKAFTVLGLIAADGSAVTCPVCKKTSEISKFKFFEDGGYKHFSSGAGCWGKGGTALDLLKEVHGFPDAVRILAGKPTSVEIVVPDVLPSLEVNTFKAVTDPEVFAGVLTYGRKAFGGEGAAAARAFYGQWHIDPDVVDEFGAVVITRPEHFAESIQARFGLERLLASGLFVINKNEQPMCLVGKKWPVIEPGRDASGNITNLQFRASTEQYAKYLSHKAGDLPYEGNQKFINLRGVPDEAYLGCGLDRIAKLTERRDVLWVEGFKDTMASTTMGATAYGIPGVSFPAKPAVVDVMRPHRVVLALDGDDAGRKGVFGTPVVDVDGNVTGHTQGLIHRLSDAGLDTTWYELPESLDVTDTLVLRHAAAGCGCAECVKMRARLQP